jgi:DhnA family fructose-bisphosphate aldolase class Ia
MAVEAGADIVAAPYVGDEKSMRAIVEVAGQTPVVAVDDPEIPLSKLRGALSSGCTGLLLRERLASGGVEETVAEARLLVHGC